MAKAKKRTKDLDPKARGRNVRGGNLPDDQKNIDRSVNQIKKSVTDSVTKLPKNGVRANPI